MPKPSKASSNDYDLFIMISLTLSRTAMPFCSERALRASFLCFFHWSVYSYKNISYIVYYF